MSAGSLSPATLRWIQKELIQHACTGGVPCRPAPPSGPAGGHQTEIGREELRSRIEALDLDCIKFKLMHPTEGRGLSREEADHLEILYRRFLFMAVSGENPFMPTMEIDEVWHAHILDTAKYREDCEAAFGFILDHFPYFGLRGEEDMLNMVRLFMDSCRRYEQEYGEQYAEMPDQLRQLIPNLDDPFDFSEPGFLSLPERPGLEVSLA
ncbi:MAG: hypothetical protein WEG36_11000 [Gemmatimonadota bacterium]